MTNLIFDTITFFFIISPILYYLKYFKNNKTNFKKIKLLILIIFSFTVIYGSFIEPQKITISNTKINNGHNNIKAVFIADFHLGPYKGENFVEKVINQVDKINPDLVLLGGDYVYNSSKYAPLIKNLSPLAKKYNTFAILGNHEYDISIESRDYDIPQAIIIENILKETGITLLKDSNTIINIKGKDIQIVGINDIFYEYTDINMAFKNYKPDLFTIVLAHNPDTALYIDNNYRFDFMLSGHTHGGQIRLPIIGPILPIPNHLGRKYDKGKFTINNHKVIITSGIGETGPRARLFNQPEILIIDL